MTVPPSVAFTVCAIALPVNKSDAAATAAQKRILTMNRIIFLFELKISLASEPAMTTNGSEVITGLSRQQ
jgi:hypothetical protein